MIRCVPRTGGGPSTWRARACAACHASAVVSCQTSTRKPAVSSFSRVAYWVDILCGKSQLDEALAMHPEHLPTAEAMGDSDSIALIQFSCARIRFRRDGWEKG
jgi:hypothetical protein